MSARRMWALIRREVLELWRDPFRLISSFLAPAVLMIFFGFGLTLDIENVPYATFDRDHTPQSRAYLEQYAHSRYFENRGVVMADFELERRFASGELGLAIEIPSGFGRDLKAGRAPQVALWIEGTMPFRAETVRGYVEAMHGAYINRSGRMTVGELVDSLPAEVETRFWYNQALESKFAFVPGLIAVMLILAPAMLTSVAVVREKELGSITYLYATPVTRLEYVWGKQLPYVAISVINFIALFLLATVFFEVPFKGSFPALLAGAVLCVLSSTGIGLLVSVIARTQVAALLIVVIVTIVPAFIYSGLLTPATSLSGAASFIGQAFPAMYFLDIAVATFTKGLGFADLLLDYLVLTAFAAGFSVASILLLARQEP